MDPTLILSEGWWFRNSDIDHTEIALPIETEWLSQNNGNHFSSSNILFIRFELTWVVSVYTNQHASWSAKKKGLIIY